MSDPSFSALAKELRKSKSLILAGKSAVDGASSSEFRADADSRSVVSDALDAEDEFQELARWCSEQPTYKASFPEHPMGIHVPPSGSEAIDDLSHKDGHDDIVPILIKSVGTVKQRYRQLQKDAEKADQIRASRLKRNFTEPLKAAPEPFVVTDSSSTIIPEEEERGGEAVLQKYDIVVERLSYSTFCTDFEYKNRIISLVKDGKRKKKTILLRTDALDGDDALKQDGRQVLRAVFMQTISPGEFSCIPPIAEDSGFLQMEII